jgi:hypothetical protein
MALNWECPHCHRRWTENRKKCKCGYLRTNQKDVAEGFIPSRRLVITGFISTTSYFALIEYFTKFFKM